MHEAYEQVLLNFFLSLALGTGIFIYKVLLQKKIDFLVILILISILPLVSIFRIGTYESGDLTLHSIFLQSFFENLKNGILIPQWAGGLCGGQGCPVFIFEYVSPFYIGSIFHAVGFSYLDSIKLFLAFSFILSAFTMYIFLEDELEPFPAFTGSLLYLFAPIHLIEMHFRVSVGTHAAFIFIPLAFLFAKKSLTGNPYFIILGSLNFFLLILSHSSIAFMTLPASFIYAFARKKRLNNLIYPFISFILGFGISAYYVIPALLELKYTWYSQTIKSIDDFKPLLEYVFSPARFGFLFQGNNGEIRLIIGYAHIVALLFSIYLFFKHKFSKKNKNTIIFFLIYFSTCFLLMLSFTKIIWDNIFFLRSFVLPWRMLVPIAFITSYLGASITSYLGKKTATIFCIFIIFSTILNWGNRKMVPIDPQAYEKHWSLYTEYFEPSNFLYSSRYKQRVGEIPKLVLNRPISHLEIIEGTGSIKETTRTQSEHEYLINAQTNLYLSENTYYFPGWKIYANEKEIPINIKDKKRFGTLTFSLESGLYILNAKFQDTQARKIGKLISLISFFITILLIFPTLFPKIRSKTKIIKG